jgi:hypothetical protein
VAARGEAVLVAIWVAELTGDVVFQQLQQAHPQWSLDNHRSMPFIGFVEEFIYRGIKTAAIALPLPLLVNRRLPSTPTSNSRGPSSTSGWHPSSPSRQVACSPAVRSQAAVLGLDALAATKDLIVFSTIFSGASLHISRTGLYFPFY